VAPGEVVGEVLPEHAAAWGLPRGIRVFSAINDTQALTFGTASHVGDRLGVSIGTTLVPTTLVDAMRADLRHFLLTQPAPIPVRHVLMAEAASRARRRFVLEGAFCAWTNSATIAATTPFAALDRGGSHRAWRRRRALPALADGSLGARGRSKSARGFLNLSSRRRAHLVRAALERRVPAALDAAASKR
jgi:sugar (pentulose or hexulose) kinase